MGLADKLKELADRENEAATHKHPGEAAADQHPGARIHDQTQKFDVTFNGPIKRAPPVARRAEPPPAEGRKSHSGSAVFSCGMLRRPSFPSVPRAGVISLLAACAVAAGGCGSSAVTSAAEQTAQSACLAASANIKDPTAKRSADQACRAVGSGKSKQLIRAAIQAARQACLQAANQLSDPTAKAATKAVCPAGK